MTALAQALKDYGFSQELIKQMVDKHHEIDYQPIEIRMNTQFEETRTIIFHSDQQISASKLELK